MGIVGSDKARIIISAHHVGQGRISIDEERGWPRNSDRPGQLSISSIDKFELFVFGYPSKQSPTCGTDSCKESESRSLGSMCSIQIFSGKPALQF